MQQMPCLCGQTSDCHVSLSNRLLTAILADHSCTGCTFDCYAFYFRELFRHSISISGMQRSRGNEEGIELSDRSHNQWESSNLPQSTAESPTSVEYSEHPATLDVETDEADGFGELERENSTINLIPDHTPRTRVSAAAQKAKQRGCIDSTDERLFRCCPPLRNWRSELLSWLAGSVLTGFMLAAVFIHNNRPVDSWMPWKLHIAHNVALTLFTLAIQFFFTVCLSSCISQLKWLWIIQERSKFDLQVFDDASRGPGACFLLFCHTMKAATKDRQAGTLKQRCFFVPLGALTMFLMFAMSISMQAAVQAEPRNVFAPGDATIRCANNCSIHNYNIHEPHPRDKDLLQGFNEGMTKNEVSFSDVAGTCPTGTCTWNGYDTLAVCAQVSPPAYDMDIRCIRGYPGSKPLPNKHRHDWPNCQFHGNESIHPSYDEQFVKETVNGMGFSYSSFSPTQYQTQNWTSRDIYFAGKSLSRNDTNASSMGNIDLYKVRFSICVHSFNSSTRGKETNTTLVHTDPDPSEARLRPIDSSAPNSLRCARVGEISACFGFGDEDSRYASDLLGFLTDHLRDEKGDQILRHHRGIGVTTRFHQMVIDEMTKLKGAARLDLLMEKLAISFTNGYAGFLLSVNVECLRCSQDAPINTWH